MPKKWRNNWDMPEDPEHRDWTLLTLGNLAIITSSLNASIRDANWQTKKKGVGSRNGLMKYAVGLETISDFLRLDEWNEDHIYERAEWLYGHAADIWHIEGLSDDASEGMDTNQEKTDQIHPTDRIESNDPPAFSEKEQRESNIYAVRRKYWDTALKIIREAHGPTGSFRYVTTSKEYWMNGSFGISGFYITCEAKMERASVLLTLGKSDRDKNKSAFDYLYERKDEIETELGTEVYWWRFNEGKAAYIDIDCKEKPIGIYRENSWETMAQFHAEWSKKFYDVFVPRLREWNAIQP